MSQSKNLDYLNMSENNKLTGNRTLVMRNSSETPNIMHAIAHSFQPLDVNDTIANISSKFFQKKRLKQSLKLVYRFIKK